MAAPTKRIVVDGVDFRRLFRFPTILRAAMSSLQPPRLVVGLLMVVTVVAFGRLWDGTVEPRVDAAGLIAGSASVDVAQSRQITMHETLRDLEVPHNWTLETKLDPRDVLAAMESSHQHRRSTLEAGARTAADDRYFAARARVQAMTPRGPFGALSAEVVSAVQRTVKGTIYLRPQMIFEAGADLFMRTPIALWRTERVFAIAFGIILVIVLALGGGALSRMAACDVAGHERLRVRDAFDFALGNWVTLVLTPVLPLLIAGGIAIVMTVLGLLLAPWIDVVGGVLYGVLIVFGFLLAFLLLGYAVAFPLLLPAVACENCDAVDAQQRAYAYVLNRPLHLLGYMIVALVGLALGYVVVAFVAATTLNLTATLVGLLGSPGAMLGAGSFTLFDLWVRDLGSIHPVWHETWAASAIGFWQRVVIDLVAAYVVVYVFTASTTVYLLMRQACDGQEIEEIWRPGMTPGTLVPLPRARVDHDDA